MTMAINDMFHRTALLGVHDGTHDSIDAALAAHAATGVAIVTDVGQLDMRRQAALCTAVATAVRAFGQVIVITHGDAVLAAGPHRGRTVDQMLDLEGARRANDLHGLPARWPVIYLGDAAELVHDADVQLRASWNNWTAHVHPLAAGIHQPREGNNVLAAIAAAALGVHEAFGAVQDRPGSDVGWRTITLNLWNPGTADTGPELVHAPAAWWLVGLGHLGQAYVWVLSWLTYTEPATIQIVLQDDERLVDANHSTGLLTPIEPTPARKTRLAAAALDGAGYDVVILDRRLDHTSRVLPDDYHVALLGVDKIEPRRLISEVGWKLAIDAGLGAGPADFNAILLRRFPAQIPSGKVPGWAGDIPRQRRAQSAALDNLESRDPCGSALLAGTAVGAAFVGAITACLAAAQAARTGLADDGFDVVSLHLNSDDTELAPVTGDAEVLTARLLIP